MLGDLGFFLRHLILVSRVSHFHIHPRAMCISGEVNQRRWSVVLAATLVVYCGEFIIFSNNMKKTCHLPLILVSFTVSERLGVVMLDNSEQGGDKTRICVIHNYLSKAHVIQ